MPQVMDLAFWIEPTMLAGEAAFVRHLIMGLKSEGQEITFIAPAGLSLAELPVLGSRVLTYRWNRWEKLPVLQRFRLKGLARALTDAPPDVLVAWGSAEGGGGAALTVLSQMAPALPVVLWCWDASELFTPLAKLPSVQHIVVSSDAIAARVQEGRGVGGNAWGRGAEGGAGGKTPVTVIHPGVFCEEAPACFDVEGQMPCLVSLDPLSNQPAYESLLRACRKMADRRHEFLLFAYDQGARRNIRSGGWRRSCNCWIG